MLAPKTKHKDKSRRDSQQRRTVVAENTRAVSTQHKGFNQQHSAGPVVSLAAVQKKVNVGPPNDAYEQEADSVASHVVSGQKAPAITPLSAAGPATAHAGTAQRQAEQDKEVVQTSLIQLQQEEEEARAKADEGEGETSEVEKEPVEEIGGTLDVKG